MQNGLEFKSCKTCQNHSKREFEDLCGACSLSLSNYCPKFSKLESFISPYVVIYLVLMFAHLITLVIMFRETLDSLTPIFISFGIWVLGYFCLVLNDLSWKFSMHRVKQKHRMKLINNENSKNL
jgi:hypothetical protein